jgi:hydroxypyruvate isomerase
MDRRQFTKNLFMGSALLSVSPSFCAMPQTAATLLKAKEAPFKMKYAPHFGMFENSAGKDLIDQLKFMSEMGFTAMEDNGMMGRPIETQKKVGETMAQLGMTMGVFVISFDNWPPKTTLASGDKEWREKFLSTCREAVEVAKRCNAKWMTVVPGNFARSLPMGYQMSHVIESLRQAAAIFEPHGLVMVLEPLSDNPDLFMRFSDQTYLLCRGVNSPSCKILFDMWHMQRNEGNLIDHMNLAWDEIGYFQIGDNPGRKEPTTGEINYKNIFKHIANKGFTGILGMEHGNFYKGKEGEMKLIEAYRASDI